MYDAPLVKSKTLKNELYNTILYIMEVTLLNSKGDGVFRVHRQDGEAKISLKEADKFKMCAKSCDGSYHSVNSEIAFVFGQYAHLLKTGNVGFIVGKLSPDESLHGQRYIIYKKNENEALLLGNVVSAVKKLAEAEE